MSRLLVAQRALTVPGWAKDALWRSARAVPSLDLRFADNKSLVDAVTGASLVTFTRASSGTYVDSAGVLQTAVTNLLLRSEEFDNVSIWGVLNVTVSANTQVAPNGTISADTITDVNGVTSANVGCFQSTTLADSTTYAMSCYVKAGTKTTCRVGIRDKAGVNIFANFNLATASTTVGNAVSSTIQDAGNGWYRCTTICASATGATSPRGLVYMDTGSYTANGTGTIHVWGAQLEQSATVGEYIPTTSAINSAPRFDHNPTTGESLGLLVEEQRTNSVRNNTMVGAVAGTPGTLPTNWSVNTIAAGLTRTVVETGVENGISYIDLRINGTTSDTNGLQLSFEGSTTTAAANGQAWVNSFYCKVAAGALANITTAVNAVNMFSAVPTNLAAIDLNFTPASSATPLGLARIVNPATLNQALTASVQPRIRLTIPSGVAVDVTLRIGLPQLEQGAFATSAIPTTTAAATRSADVASITGTAFSRWYNQSEGTIYHQGRTPTAANFFSIDDGTVDNRITSYMPATTAPAFFVATGGVTQANISSSAITAGSMFAQASVYKAADFVIVTNGGTVSTDTSGSVPTVNRMVIGANNFGTANINGYIRRLTYWPQSLPSRLQALTQ